MRIKSTLSWRREGDQYSTQFDSSVCVVFSIVDGSGDTKVEDYFTDEAEVDMSDDGEECIESLPVILKDYVTLFSDSTVTLGHAFW